MLSLQNKNVISSCSETVDNMFIGWRLKVVQLCGFVAGVQKKAICTSLLHRASTALYHYFYSVFKVLNSVLYTVSTRPTITTMSLDNLLLLSQEDNL